MVSSSRHVRNLSAFQPLLNIRRNDKRQGSHAVGVVHLVVESKLLGRVEIQKSMQRVVE